MSRSPVLYQETRISLPPSSPSSTLHINTAPSGALTTFSSSRKRPFDEISGLDEENYARKHLATEGSVYFRPTDKFPRTFLWRVLNDRKLLEVRCVDLVRSRKDANRQARLTFNIEFADRIIPSGVAFADAEAKDGLEVFVLTAGNELYTISLRRDLLLRESVPADFEASTCVKRFASGSFGYKHPYRLVATSSLELLVSLHDGSLLRLTREVTDSGATWRETHFSEGGWSGTLKRSFPIAMYKQRTERYGDIDLFGDAIAAIALGPAKEKSTDANVAWTVSLDHTLKAWDLGTGKILSRSDLVEGEEEVEDSRRSGKYMMSPEQGTLMQIVTLPKASGSRGAAGHGNVLYWIVVHSPKDHQFKFYAVKENHSSVDTDQPLLVHDAQPRVKLIPPFEDLLETNIWHLEQFAVKPGPRWEGSQLWIRARTGAVCKTFMLTFDLLDQGSEVFDIEADFKTGWTVVDWYSQSIKQLCETSEYNQLDRAIDGEATPSEKWIDFLFAPGRFSEVSVEAALHMYREGRKLPASSKSGLHANDEPLKARIINAVTAKVLLRRLPNEQPDYARYQDDLQAQWNTFFRILSHLHNRRCESIGFALDLDEGLPWTVCADYVAPIRSCTGFEMLSLNAHTLAQGEIFEAPEDLRERIFPQPGAEHDEDKADENPIVKSRIMSTARQLRQYFSAVSQEKMRSIAVSNALDVTAEMGADDALQAIYAESNFQDEVRNEDYDSLNDAAEEYGGLATLTVDTLLMVIESTEDDHGAVGNDLGESLARYGEYMTSVIVRESYQRTEAVLLDILALVVLLHCDLEEDTLSPDFSAPEVYDAIMLRLRNNELRKWLTANVRREDGELRSLYACMFAQDFEPKPDRRHVDYGLPEMLTGWSKHWAYDLNLSDWGGITEHVLADLLKHKETDLALEFEKFLPDTPFISYLRGRLYLSVGDYGQSHFLLERVTEDMGVRGCPKNFLLTDEEVNFFGKGPVFYLQHVSSLFEKLKAFSYTVDLTGLALSHINDVDVDSAIQAHDRKSLANSPVKQKVNENLEYIRALRLSEARAELVNRRFNALVQTGHFDDAYETFLRIKNPALHRQSLTQLIKSCIDRNAISTLLDLPIQGDQIPEADSILLSLAKKNMTQGLPSGPQYHQILFSFRAQNGEFRGAAAILYEYLEHLKVARRGMGVGDPEDEGVLRIYVLVIGCLARCEEGDGWLLADDVVEGGKRRLVRLEDLRREYVKELDWRSEVAQGRFGLVGGEGEMEL